jgi:orotate phosphoribosyltransferase
VDQVEGYPVRSIYSVDDLPDYESYDYRECPYCKRGRKLDALVNSFGFSAI